MGYTKFGNHHALDKVKHLKKNVLIILIKLNVNEFMINPVFNNKDIYFSKMLAD